MDKKLKIANSVVASTILAIIFLVAITVVGDLQPPVKNWLKNSFNHHWIGKGILAVALFIATSFLLSLLPLRVEENKLAKNLWRLFWITIIGAMVIFGFYLYETFI